MKFAVCAFILLAFAATSRWIFYGSELSHWLPLSAPCVVAAISLLTRREWSKHFLFGAALFVCVTWLTGVATTPWRYWREHSLLNSSLSLVPGLLWSGVWLGTYLAVRTHPERSVPSRS